MRDDGGGRGPRRQRLLPRPAAGARGSKQGEEGGHPRQVRRRLHVPPEHRQRGGGAHEVQARRQAG